ncbi:GNAT family N-acetyltransferase [Salinibacillus aidingensis]|uniref:GNAT family N-acetyltransferase n=1 Tax=Salinibacillus aidingensis TaxID=237684 RepID=A0ABN1BAJ3_9BACI
MRIRQALVSDALDIAKVQVNSWKTTYKGIVPSSYLNQMTFERRQPKWEELIRKTPVFVAENKSGEIVGFANGGNERTGTYPGYPGELYAIYLLQEYQRMGVGQELWKNVVDVLRQNGMDALLVWVLKDNPSRFFYESLGAEEIDQKEIEIGGKRLIEVAYGW